MGADAVVVLVILGGAFVLFVSDWLRPDLVAILVLIALVLVGIVEPLEAFRGFGSFAVMAVAGLMVIGEGLQRTGVVQWVARRLEKVIHGRPRRLLVVNTLVPGLLSGFVNIVAAASFFIPVILRLCTRMSVPQSKILLPMACTALIGANLSLIGASHNLVVDSLLEDSTGTGFGFFEFAPVGAALLVVALAYVLTIGRRLLPEHETVPPPTSVPVGANLVDVYELEDRLNEAFVSSTPEDRTLRVRDLGHLEVGVTLVTLVREGDRLIFPEDHTELVAGDVVLLQGREEVVRSLCQSEPHLAYIGAPQVQKRYPISTAELAEAVVPPRSPLIGTLLGEVDLTRESGMIALAAFRQNRPIRTGIQNLELAEGDAVLFYGPRDRMREFDPEKDMLIYFKPGEPEVESRMKRWAPAAAAILIAAVVVAALDWFPIAITALAGAALMAILGIVSPERTYRAVDWRTLVLIAGMYPLGSALQSSGAADAVGRILVGALGGLGPVAVLGGVAVLTMVLTQPIHNAAVAIIMTPIALQAAESVGADPRGFCVAVVVACSATFLMPYGHPAPFLVQEPGGYSPGDYLRFGIGLNVLTLAVILALVPLLWSL